MTVQRPENTLSDFMQGMLCFPDCMPLLPLAQALSHLVILPLMFSNVFEHLIYTHPRGYF